MKPTDSEWLKDEGTWLVVYYKKENATCDSLHDFQEALKSAEMGLVPEFWINYEAMVVMLPPCQENHQLTSAAFKRYQIGNDWEEYEILKIRYDSARKNFFEAQAMLKICEDYSSGAEEAFQNLNDKSRRHSRHKIKLSGDDNESRETVQKKKNLATIKKEKIGKSGRKENESKMINQLPSPPTRNLLNVASTSAQNVDDIDIFHEVEVHSQKDAENDNRANRNNEDMQNVDPCSSDLLLHAPMHENRKPLKSITNVSKSLTPFRQLKKLSDVGAVETEKGLVLAVNENLQVVNENLLVVDQKLNTAIGNQHRMITNQAKAKVLGTVPSDTDTDKDASWNEKKRIMATVFKKITTLQLFLEFDEELKNSAALRERAGKYLSEKMTREDWMLTTRSILNAAMTVEVQTFYNGQGKKGAKRPIIETALYPILEGIILESSKKIDLKTNDYKNSVPRVSTDKIISYLGSYIRGASGKLKSRAASKKNVKLAETLLFGNPPTKKQKKTKSSRDAVAQQQSSQDDEDDDEEEARDANQEAVEENSDGALKADLESLMKSDCQDKAIDKDEIADEFSDDD